MHSVLGGACCISATVLFDTIKCKIIINKINKIKALHLPGIQSILKKLIP